MTSTYIGGVIQVKAFRIMQSDSSKVLHKFDINATQWFMLSSLYTQSDGLRASQFARDLGVEAPLISALTLQLEKSNLLTRQPHPSDARAKLLILTPEGRKLVEKIEPKLSRVMNKLTKGIDKRDLITYEAVLKKIIRNGS